MEKGIAIWTEGLSHEENGRPTGLSPSHTFLRYTSFSYVIPAIQEEREAGTQDPARDRANRRPAPTGIPPRDPRMPSSRTLAHVRFDDSGSRGARIPPHCRDDHQAGSGR